MVSENKLANNIFNCGIKVLYELSAVEGDSPVYYQQF